MFCWKSLGLKWFNRLNTLNPTSACKFFEGTGSGTRFVAWKSSDEKRGYRPASFRLPMKSRSSSTIEYREARVDVQYGREGDFPRTLKLTPKKEAVRSVEGQRSPFVRADDRRG